MQKIKKGVEDGTEMVAAPGDVYPNNGNQLISSSKAFATVPKIPEIPDLSGQRGAHGYMQRSGQMTGGHNMYRVQQ